MYRTRQRQRFKSTYTQIFDQAKTHEASDVRLSHEPTALSLSLTAHPAVTTQNGLRHQIGSDPRPEGGIIVTTARHSLPVPTAH